MRFQCPNCLSIVSIDDSEAGQAVACGHCEKIIAVPTSRTAPGAVIDDFVIEKEIGHGGLATVYLAHQLSLDRSVALKILYEQYAEDEEFTANFLREARAAAQLNHPNIVQAHAVGEEDGIHFFAMEYVQGTTLKNVLAHSGRLVIDRALLITQEIAKALDFAWTSKNLVHRDIKPDNIILTEEGQVKLADLGLARVGKDILQEGSSEILGTPQYIAPELLLGKPADNRTDIYSLGATLFHAVTGEYPFHGNSAAEIARKHISEPMPDPRTLVKDIPDAVAKLIGIMMAKRPGHRFSSAKELIEELGRVQNGEAPEHTLTKSFQLPIDLNNVDTELEMKPEAEPEQAETAGTGKAAAATGVKGRKLSVSKSAKATGGKRKVTLKRGKAGKTSAKATGKSNGGAPATQKPETAGDGDDQVPEPQPLMPAGADEQMPDKDETDTAQTAGKKKKSSSKLFVTVMVVFLLLAVIAVVGLIFLAQWQKERQAAQQLAEQGLNKAQAEAVQEYELFVGRNPMYQTALEKAADLLDTYPDADTFRDKIMAAAAPFLEKELRQVRENRHGEEMRTWQTRSRELRDQLREQRLAEQRAQLEAQREADRLADQQRRDEDRQRRIAELTEEKRKLRRRAVALARQHEFDDAKALFTAMKLSDIDEFSDWAEAKQESLDLAKRAYNLVRDSDDLLKGVRISVKNQPRGATIVSIGFEFISAEIREKVYERGVEVGEDIEPLTVPLSELSTQQIVKLMEEAWKRQGGEQSELDLLVGAYLLSRGEYLNISQQRLERSNLSDKTDPMLEELDAMREAARAES